MNFVISKASGEDLRLVLDWAASEGWNPGLDDAAAFYAADPNGFLVGWVGAEPVAAISAVRHSDEYGFIGLYICQPKYRGKGFGTALFRTGLEYLEDRCIGLDGVLEQQENYSSSGFGLAHVTQRYEGKVPPRADHTLKPADDFPIAALVEFDAEMSGGSRENYMRTWFTDTPTRKTLVGQIDNKVTSLGTIRQCLEGHKVGPLYAPDAKQAENMLQALVAVANASYIIIDMPDTGPGAALARDPFDLKSQFQCARMYAQGQRHRDMSRIFGETTFELG